MVGSVHLQVAGGGAWVTLRRVGPDGLVYLSRVGCDVSRGVDTMVGVSNSGFEKG